ncbi:hypothetical protein RI367_002088 [Sorochytrium milnesiophthora]
MIEPEGIERLCADIGFPAESVDILVLAYTLGARRMGYFSRDEWLSGMSKLSAHSAAQLAKRLPSETARVLGDRAALEDLHKYAFNFSKAPESRNVDIDTALAMWSLYFVQFGDRLRRFAEFLQEKRPVKVVNRDQWLSMFEFLFQVNDDLSNYDDLQNFIDGKFCEPHHGRYMDTFCPATGEVYAHLADSTAEDVEAAVAAAKRAFRPWADTPRAQRSAILLKVAQLLEDKLDEFAQAESEDQGKPVTTAKTVDIPRAIHNFRFFATSVLHSSQTSTELDGVALNYVHRSPVGVAGLISPWNLPLYLLTWKIAPCIATGNTCVCKPSEFTSVTAYKLCGLLNDAGVPPGVVNMVFGTGPDAGSALVGHPKVPLISFTGGTATGERIITAAAPHFKKLSLELGGKNAALIFEDADLDKAVATTVRSSFSNQGEICLCTSRIFVQRSIYDEFVSRYVQQVQQLKLGNPKDKNTFMGALVSQQHMQKVLSYIDLAQEEGGSIMTGGKRVQDIAGCEGGWFVQPTVITGLHHRTRCMQEEIFGPVTCVYPFDTEDEAIEWANDVTYGLAASTKQSGIGREGALHSLEFFTEEKTVCMADMSIRRAETSDAPLVEELVRGQTAEDEAAEAIRQADIARTIDIAALSLIQCDADEAACLGFAAFHYTAAELSPDRGLEPQPPPVTPILSENWVDPLQSAFPQLDCQYHNTLFLRSIVTQNNNADAKFLLTALRHAFAVAPLLRSVLFVADDADQIPACLKASLSELVPKASSKSTSDATTLFVAVEGTKAPVSVWRCRREHIFPRLNIRRARMEDCDDLIPMFKRQGMLEAAAGDYYVAELLEPKNKDMKTLVADMGGKVVGFMSLSRSVPTEDLVKTFWLETYADILDEEVISTEPPRFASISSPSLPRLDAIKPSDESEKPEEETDGPEVHDEVTLTSALSQTGLAQAGTATNSVSKLAQAAKAVPAEEQQQQTVKRATCNAFCIQLFCIEDAYALQSVDFLLPAFTLFPERDYCLLTTTTTAPEIPLLSRFTQVLPKQSSNIASLLYLTHRFAVTEAVSVQPARRSSIPEICDMINNLSIEGAVEDLLSKCEQEFEPRRADGYASFVVQIHGQIVGNAVLEYCDVSDLAVSYDTEQFFNPAHHVLQKKPAILRHFLINPLFEWYTRYIIQELFRICRSTVLFYKVDDTAAMDEATRRLMCIHMVPVRYRTAASTTVQRYQGTHALLMLCANQVYEPKITVNHRIVLVGDSDTALGCVEELVYTTHVRFANVTLVSLDGLREHEDEDDSFYDRTRRQDFVQVIQRASDRVRLRQAGLLHYDFLLMAPGLQSDYMCEPWAVPDMKGVWNVHRSMVHHLKDELDYIANHDVPGGIYVYGNDRSGCAALGYLLKAGVARSRITLLLTGDGSGFEDSSDRDMILEYLRAQQVNVRVGVTISQVQATDKRINAVCIGEEPSAAEELPCALLAYCRLSRINPYSFRAVNDCSLVYDGGIVIGNAFDTKDPKIFAAGPATKYSRKYQTLWQHAYYDSRNVGQKLASVVLRACDPLWEEEGLEPGLLLHFQAPKAQHDRVYFHFDTPRLPSDTLDARKVDPAYGRDLTTQTAQTKFTIHLDTAGYITSITYFGPSNAPLDKYLALSGMHEKYLNAMVTRYTDGLIQDFAAYFEEPWATAVLHDRFTEFVREMRHTLVAASGTSKDAQALYNKLTPFIRENTDIPSGVLDELYQQFDQSSLREAMDRRLQRYARPLLP